ncbi:hypothetical protein BD410DRAFT_506080 [Rickenella mellea]|uniref:Uncharacterized protein n=1 Tax=Rickenella mellea TaxID=50990 RepID=A0A4Y7PUB8_9AGAM|nr:hypothetical protein BD410DRAFT_506080 [Rickenella mellea]
MSPSKRKFQNNSGADIDGFQTPFQRLDDHDHNYSRDAAEKLANVEHSTTPQGSNSKGSGLVRWICEGKNEDTWVDRYDARLLLTSLPASSMTKKISSFSPQMRQTTCDV